MHDTTWTLEDERRLREIRPWMKPARDWRDLDPLDTADPLPTRFVDRLAATLVENRDDLGPLLHKIIEGVKQ